jgi:hypothetical protein
MGYLLNDSFIIRRTFIIPEADVQFMDASQPYTLITTNNTFYAIPVFCYLKAANNQTTPYDVFNFIALVNTGGYSSGKLCGTYTQAASAGGVIDNILYYSMCMNFSVAPDRVGGINADNNLEIYWDTLPASGDGDLIVNLGYIIQPI